MSWDLSEKETEERELRALKEAMKELKCKKALLLTYETFVPKEIDKNITILPAYKYLMMDPESKLKLLFE